MHGLVYCGDVGREGDLGATKTAVQASDGVSCRKARGFVRSWVRAYKRSGKIPRRHRGYRCKTTFYGEDWDTTCRKGKLIIVLSALGS